MSAEELVRQLRDEIEALLALRCALLSGRWDATWQSLAPASHLILWTHPSPAG